MLEPQSQTKVAIARPYDVFLSFSSSTALTAGLPAQNLAHFLATCRLSVGLGMPNHSPANLKVICLVSIAVWDAVTLYYFAFTDSIALVAILATRYCNESNYSNHPIIQTPPFSRKKKKINYCIPNI